MDRNNISPRPAEVNELFQSILSSPTITARFGVAHIVLALFDFAENSNGIGRYALRKNLHIGEGMARSIVKKLKEKDLITRKSTRTGHVLTPEGERILASLKSQIPFCGSAPDGCKDLIIKGIPYFCLVRGGASRLGLGIGARDAAIKLGGLGATCLVVGESELFFPREQELEPVPGDFYNVFEEIIHLGVGDVIVIGAGEDEMLARLAAMNAALSLTKFLPG
jgi:predicted transcriptional regulator